MTYRAAGTPRAKAWRERAVGSVLLVPASPLLAAGAAAIWLEGKLDPRARGPVLFREPRVASGRVIELLKFRTLDASALAELGPGPTHIAMFERAGRMTRSGRLLKQWYLDELPQLWNVARGDIGLVGTRPYPIELYEEELARGITRKRDMPSGLVGPVQSRKGTPMDALALDLEYWDAVCSLPWWRLLALDVRIILRSLRVLLEHKGI
jgi:lipopolysaccharide/colanic/teichoic acid biosynthesis glycosyltransferase